MNQKKVQQKSKPGIKKPPVKSKSKVAMLEKQHIYLLIVLMVAIFVAYLPSLSKEFINYDDDLYITNNPLINHFSLSGIPAIFGQFYYAQYSPLPTVVYGILYLIVGFKPFLFNLTGVFFHLTATLLVFQLIWLLVKNFRVAFLTAAMFGLATIQVESVAWLAAVFKTGTYSIFFLSSLIMYIKYTRSGNNKHLIYSLLLFIISCFCKEQTVALSLAVVAIDLFLGRKLFSKKVLLEKIPYFAVSVGFGLLAMAAALAHGDVTATSFSFLDRIIYACYALCNYFVKSIIPYKLAMFYPYPSLKHLGFIHILCPIIVLVVIGLWIWAVKKKQAFIMFGGLFFLVNILFSLALQVISVREVVMADRYMYLACIGLFFMIAWGANMLVEKKLLKFPVIAIIFAVYLLITGFLTYNRTKDWKNSVVAYTALLETDPSVEMAYRNRGNFYRDKAKEYIARQNTKLAQEMTDLAFKDFSSLIEVDPQHSTAYVSRGRIYFDRGEYEKALADFSMAIKLDPKYAEAYSNRGAVYGQKNQMDLALNDFNEALKFDPKWKDALLNRSMIYYSLKQFDKAIPDLDAYFALAPGKAESYNLRALCKVEIKDYNGALNDYNLALQYQPNTAIYFQNRSLLYLAMGNKAKALEDITKAQQLGVKVPQDYLDQLK